MQGLCFPTGVPVLRFIRPTSRVNGKDKILMSKLILLKYAFLNMPPTPRILSIMTGRNHPQRPPATTNTILCHVSKSVTSSIASSQTTSWACALRKRERFWAQGSMSPAWCTIKTRGITKSPFSLPDVSRSHMMTNHISGLKLFGKNWKLMAVNIPTRSDSQIRSHAQKFFKKISASGNSLQVNNAQNPDGGRNPPRI